MASDTSFVRSAVELRRPAGLVRPSDTRTILERSLLASDDLWNPGDCDAAFWIRSYPV